MLPIRDYNPPRRRALLTWGLILINFGVYFYLAQNPVMDENAIARYAVTPADITAGRHLGTLITSMFLHANLLHVAGNMLFLWIFGNNVEDHLGHIGFTIFYFVVGVAAMAAHYLADPGSTQPVIGASGAIAGVMGAYLVFWPRARVLSVIALLFFLPVYLPAAVLLAIWFGSQFVTSFNPNSGVAWVAHVGGFVAGAGIALALRGLFGPPRQRVRPAGPPQWGWGR